MREKHDLMDIQANTCHAQELNKFITRAIGVHTRPSNKIYRKDEWRKESLGGAREWRGEGRMKERERHTQILHDHHQHSSMIK